MSRDAVGGARGCSELRHGPSFPGARRYRFLSTICAPPQPDPRSDVPLRCLFRLANVGRAERSSPSGRPWRVADLFRLPWSTGVGAVEDAVA